MGTMRFVLAMAVVAFHLLAIPKIGPIAVQAFFVLSGFLMTLVMHTSYDYSPSGFGRFWLNRILRLYPIYIVSLLLTLPLALIFGPARDHAIDNALGVPMTLAGWVQNATLIFYNLDTPRLSPPAWALTTELFYYLVISLGFSATRLRTWGLFAAGAAYMAWGIATGRDFYALYFSIWSGALPFGAGALLWHYREDLSRLLTGPAGNARWTWALIGAGSAGILATVGGRALASLLDLGPAAEAVMLPLTVVPAAALVLGCTRLKLTGFARRADRVLGDLSYPVYVSHFFFGMVAEGLTGLYAPRHDMLTLETFVITCVLMFAGCYLMTRLIDEPIQRMREKVRGAPAPVDVEAAEAGKPEGVAAFNR